MHLLWGGGSDPGISCTTDIRGNVYIAGYSDLNSGSSIATAGSHQFIFGGGYEDAYIVKFNPAGVRQWGTYYGGASDDWGHACATDSVGNIYLAGTTESFSGSPIATPGSHQAAYSGGYFDAFLVKLDTAGVRQWGTYYGGFGFDDAWSCATDANGNVFLAGSSDTNTGTTIATAGSHQTVYGGNSADAFLVKFNPAGVRLWGTYYGGAGVDGGETCAIDAYGNVYLAGWADTNSAATSIATPGCHQEIHGGSSDGYLVKFNSAGVRQWGTYYGGADRDFGASCATDSGGNVYLAGNTETTAGTSIATVGSHQPINGAGVVPVDAFIAKFNPAGVRQWGTYYGGTGEENAFSCTTDPSGNVYLTGQTNSDSGTAIGTVGSHQPTFGAGAIPPTDAFLVKFNQAGVRQWGTYYGGTGEEEGTDCATDANANVYLVGSAGDDGSYISTVGSHQPAYGGGWDAFLVKFCDYLEAPGTIYGDTVICSGSGHIYSIPAIPGAISYYWTLPGGWSGTSTTNSIVTFADSTSGNISVTAMNDCGASAPTTLWITVMNPTSSSITESACDTLTLNSIIYTSSGIYTQTLVNTAGCDSTLILNLTVNNSSADTLTLTACDSCTLNSSTYTSSGSYTQTLVNTAGCDSTLIIHLTIETLTATVTQAGGIFTAMPAGATYQWVNCDSGLAPIAGETNQMFTPAADGTYAVIVSLLSCTDTSACDIFTGRVGNDPLHGITAFPNPTTGDITIRLDEYIGHIQIEVLNELGKLIERKSIEPSAEIPLHISGAPGVFFVKIQSREGREAVIKIVKK